MSTPFYSKIILRCETKPFEQRTPLPPTLAKRLVDKGIEVFVETSKDRIYPDLDYLDNGCKVVPQGYWKNSSPDHVILGLKELESGQSNLPHSHIFFAHCFKGQSGSSEILQRFRLGNGSLFDLEFLVDETGRRVCAFGHWAGFVGAALAVKQFHVKQSNKLMSAIPYPTETDLINDIKSLETRSPSAIVIGAKGRCGLGAIEALEKLGVSNITKWDVAETMRGGPFTEILDHDVFINCVYLNKKIPPFLTHETLMANKKLSVITDVSCDPTSPYNPIPLYDHITTLDKPSISINDKIDLVAIDMLPSLLPKESSDDFSAQLFPHLISFMEQGPTQDVFQRSLKNFETALNNNFTNRVSI